MIHEREPLTDIFECFGRRLAKVGGRFIEDGDKGVERAGRVVVFFQAFPVFLGSYSRMRHGIFLPVFFARILFLYDDLPPEKRGQRRGKEKGRKGMTYGKARHAVERTAHSLELCNHLFQILGANLSSCDF